MTATSLESCLNAAISEAELVSDIIEACRLSNTSANDLAGWSLEDIVSDSRCLRVCASLLQSR